MGQRQKSTKSMRKKDMLHELPDEILSTIISMLSFKEAIRTSILSKSWRFVWISHPHLLFDAPNIFGSKIYVSSSQLQRREFIQQVDDVMGRRSKGLNFVSLAVHFHLGQDFGSHIDQWISIAIDKSVEEIDLDLSEGCSLVVDYEPLKEFKLYTFPCWLFAKQCTLKHLKLASCRLGSLQNPNNLTSLVTVELRDLKITDEELQNFLSACLFLENLSVNHCEELVYSKFAFANLQLKRLSIKNCFRMESIIIYSENLVMLNYEGQLVSFSFKNVPSLAQVFFVFSGSSRLDGVTYALTRFPYDLRQVEALNLISIRAMTKLNLPEEVPIYTNIKQLVLSVFPFEDEDELCWITYVLRAFPLLQKLQLNVFSPNFIKQSREIDRHLPECPHRNLTGLEINGFYSYPHEIYLLKYLIDNAVGLEVLTIDPCQKVYKEFDKWDYEEACSLYKFETKNVEWIRAAVPPTVKLIIR